MIHATSSVRAVATACACALFTFGLAGPVQAMQPGRGPTGAFEVDYLKFIIDHHYSALRTTELAAGTDPKRDAEISPTEGTSPTPQTQPAQAKAQLESVKSIARKANRMQREEILTAQQFLREWYNIDYQPRLRPESRQLITTLERTTAGRTFDQTFLRLFSRHHYMALIPSLQCTVGADVAHVDLERYCRGIVEAQMMEIDEMRHMLCDRFEDCTFQPFGASVGRREDTDLIWRQ